MMIYKRETGGRRSHAIYFFISVIDRTVCGIDKNKGCSQFCKPGYQSYECSCAWGWKLQQNEKCVPAGENWLLFLDVICINVNLNKNQKYYSNYRATYDQLLEMP